MAFFTLAVSLALAAVAAADEPANDPNEYEWTRQLCDVWLGNADYDGTCNMVWHKDGTELCPAEYSFCTAEDDETFMSQLYMPYMDSMGGVNAEAMGEVFGQMILMSDLSMFEDETDTEFCAEPEEVRKVMAEQMTKYYAAYFDMFNVNYEYLFVFYAGSYCMACSPTDKGYPHITSSAVETGKEYVEKSCDLQNTINTAYLDMEEKIGCMSKEEIAEARKQLEEYMTECKAEGDSILDDVNGFSSTISEMVEGYALNLAEGSARDVLAFARSHTRAFAGRSVSAEPTTYVVDDKNGYDIVKSFEKSEFATLLDTMEAGISGPKSKGLGAGDIAAIVLGILLAGAIAGIVFLFLKLRKN